MMDFLGLILKDLVSRKMMEDIDRGLINTVIVKDLSRLGRNYIEIGKCIQNVF